MNPTPITIEYGTERTCVNFKGYCGRDAEATEDVVIKIKRAGGCEYLIQYPGEVGEGCDMCFNWGDIMWSLDAGRYIGDVFDGDEKVGFIQFQLHPGGFSVEPCIEPEVVDPEEHECGCECEGCEETEEP